MSFAASGNEPGLKAHILATRDTRQHRLQQAFELARQGRGACVLALSTNLPGRSKHMVGLSRHARKALDIMRAWPGLRTQHSGPDALGPFHVALCDLPPREAKYLAMALEQGHPASRLLDLDVYAPDGSQVDRAALGLPPRACLLCEEPAVDCIRLRRHAPEELRRHAEGLLGFSMGDLQADRAADALARGARMELHLTPKPGLVDRHDQGSHPDLSFEAMEASILLLPQYFSELQGACKAGKPLAELVQTGRDAEVRMMAKIHTNAHKGFIFLAGLFLLATVEARQLPDLRDAISQMARLFFSQFRPRDTPGSTLRALHGLGGIQFETECGLPAIFDHGWPCYQAALDAGWGAEEAGFYLMAVLMQHVEDTTAIRRCGPEGLSRLRRDGFHLQSMLERRESPLPVLRQLNTEYCQMGLTMGGVADCMALTFALEAMA